jgi:hypothetical protein
LNRGPPKGKFGALFLNQVLSGKITKEKDLEQYKEEGEEET